MVSFKLSNQTWNDYIRKVTLHKEQSGSRSSKFAKQNVEEENVLELIINKENPPSIIDSDFEEWSFNLCSRGYHEYMKIFGTIDWR